VLETYVEWSSDEKVALDTAFTVSITGKGAACYAKQVGLNVAADPLMSAARVSTKISPVVKSWDVGGKG